MCRLVCFCLLCPDPITGSSFECVDIANSKFGQALLQPRAVGERILGSTHSTSAPNIAERVDRGLLKGIEESFFVRSVHADGHQFHCFRSTESAPNDLIVADRLWFSVSFPKQRGTGVEESFAGIAEAWPAKFLQVDDQVL